MSDRPLPPKVSERITANLRRYQIILDNARSRDVGEADTVTIVKDMLSDVFGYDKYADLTSEFSIRGTYVDLAIKMGSGIQALVEVKAIGSALKDAHAKQAVDYAANQGVDWVILTNGQTWRIYHVVFARPISSDLIVEVDICKINIKSASEIDTLYLWCKEGWQKSVLGQYKDRKQALSKFIIGSTLFAEPVLSVIRRELKRINPDVKIEIDQIAAVMAEEVVKREIIEGGCYTKPIAESGKEQPTSTKNSPKRKNLDLFEIGLKQGDPLVFIRSPEITATVSTNRKVLYNGSQMSLSAATEAASLTAGLPASLSGALSWRFEEEMIEEMRVRREATQDQVNAGDVPNPNQPLSTDIPGNNIKTA